MKRRRLCSLVVRAVGWSVLVVAVAAAWTVPLLPSARTRVSAGRQGGGRGLGSSWNQQQPAWLLQRRPRRIGTTSTKISHAAVLLSGSSSSSNDRIELVEPPFQPPPPPAEQNDDNNTNSKNHTEILWSYVYTLQRARREAATQSASGDTKKMKNQLLKPARSLAFFLEHERAAAQDDHYRQNSNLSQNNSSSMIIIAEDEPLQRATVQAIRAAASVNDYKLILQLGAAVPLYYQRHHHAASRKMDPRILGEAVEALSRTTVRVGRITQLWRQWTTTTATATTADAAVTTVVTPREVNALLQALIDKGRLRGALQFYHNETTCAESTSSTTDAYSLSILLNALTASIGDDDEGKLVAAHGPPLPQLQNEELEPFCSPVCWQWNEAVRLLDTALLTMKTTATAGSGINQQQQHILVNNPVVTALLQLNKRAAQVFRRHSGPERALWMLEFLQEHRIAPDTVTSAMLLSSLGTEWELALALLRAASQPQQSGRWCMPPPNKFMVSAVMAVCARSRQYNTTLQLLQELQDQESDDHVDSGRIQPNAYMYNSVFQALSSASSSVAGRNSGGEHVRPGRKAKRATRERAKERLETALELLQKMQVREIPPDSTTYNTLLTVVVGVSSLLNGADWQEIATKFPDLFRTAMITDGVVSSESLVLTLLEQMKSKSIACDSLTYKHAIQAVGGELGATSVLRILKRGLNDLKKKDHVNALYNAGLSTQAQAGDFAGVAQILSSMVENCAKFNAETTVHIITALGTGNMTGSIPAFLQRKIPDNDTALLVAASLGVDLRRIAATTPEAVTLLSAAVSCCLRASDFESARELLTQMRDSGLRPSQNSLQEIVLAYARIALENESNSNEKGQGPERAGNARAKSAYAILASIEDPPASLVSVVSRACCSAGMFREAHKLLRSLHRRVLAARFSRTTTYPSSSHREGRMAPWDENERVLPALHRSLLKHCAEQGNVTNALRLCEDIQYLSVHLSTTTNKESEAPSLLKSDGTFSPLAFDFKNYAAVEPEDGFGMKATEWKYLLLAAASSGHWRVCLTTLQFLRPYLEATQTSLAAADDEDHRLRLDQEYSGLESALNTAVECLAVRSQYAWVVRAIEDWIEWSGRRPPRVSALAAIRVFASRGRGEEVNALLARCTALPSSKTKGDNEAYEPMLYVGAITALYNAGLYDQADDAFVAAITQRALPFNLEHKAYGPEQRITLDLHGMNLAVAHSAVRIALQKEATSTAWDDSQLWDDGMVIVTGRGLNSALRMRPVLRPEIQRFLQEEFYPPLSTSSVPGNMGAIRVASEDISEWVSHQRQQKGARMLMIASMLKNVSSPGSRLRSSLARVAVSKSLDRAFNGTSSSLSDRT